MKKNRRRLSLNKETIRALDRTALLRVARGGCGDQSEPPATGDCRTGAGCTISCQCTQGLTCITDCTNGCSLKNCDTARCV
jgi:hypothetical protein